ncbi:MAG TPA: cupin domain-containing protein [Bryobacteraceae bacterium]|nr:cupin domain-containing protein [Bryobacteraceae bacterium]
MSAIVAPGQTPPAPKLFAAAGDVTAMIAKAKAERKPDQANFIQPIVRLAPYNANLEYRVGSVAAPASVHETEAELFYVVEGTGTMVTGGKLVDEKRTNASNLSGTKIEGGESRTLSKGDFLIVPAGTPHWITGIDGALALMTLHLPVK